MRGGVSGTTAPQSVPPNLPLLHNLPGQTQADIWEETVVRVFAQGKPKVLGNSWN